ncbi:MAG TPA: FAD binding domain-containing protein [Anaerolineales bacterium]|nr:FAD binding domain-containing protein [Anaerolineales bacterium]
MITAYHRPKTLDEALTLLAQPHTAPLGGGTLLSHPSPNRVEAVDLQAIGLNTIKKSGNNLELGATVTLQQLLESEHCPEALRTALKLEAPLNLRNAATVAGTLVSCDGRSTFASVLLALDAKLELSKLEHSNVETRVSNIGEILPLRDLQGWLITSISLPLNTRLAFEYVARTPADKPIVCAALAQWNSGRTRLALGGYGKSPLLAMDGTEAEGLETAARNAFHEAADEWGSAEYRMDVAAMLAKRCSVRFNV